MQYVDLGRLPQSNNKKKAKKRVFKFAFLALLLGLVIYSGYILYWPVTVLVKQILKQPSSVLSLIRKPEGELRIVDGRTNFLLVGIDKRSTIPYSYKLGNDTVKKNGFNSDTILVVSLDQKTKNVSMVSIPRDLWVKTKANGKFGAYSGKINSLYSIGEMQNYPSGGGMGLLKNKVEEIIGVPIQYTSRIDFDGFRKGVDILDGLDIVVDNSFDDYEYPREGFENSVCKDGTYNCQVEHIHFDKGLVSMDGSEALKYARSRKGNNGEGSDFARSKRQQKVLVAAKEKALKIQNFFDPIKINSLFKEFGQSVETDIDISAMTALYNMSKKVKTDSINSLVLSNATDNYLYVPPADQYGSAYVLLPKGNDWEKIQQAVKDLLANETQDTPASEN